MKDNTKRITSAAIVALVLAGILLSIYVAGVRSSSTARQRAQDVLRDSAREQVATLSAALDGQLGAMKLLADTIPLQSPEEMEVLIATALADLNCGLIFTTDSRGIVLYGEGRGNDYSDREYIADALSGSVGMESIVSRVTQQHGVALAVPYYQNGQVAGVLCGIYYADSLAALLSCQAYGGAGYSYIVDSSGSIIIGSEGDGKATPGGSLADAKEIVGLSEKGTEALNTFIQGLSSRQECSLYLDGSSTRVIVGIPFISAALPENDWYLINTATDAELAPEIAAYRSSSIESMLIFVVFSVSALLLFLSLRRGYERQLSLDNENMNRLINDMPGGYVCLRVFSENEMAPTYINDNSCRLAGMERSELMEVYKQDLSARVHPEDLPHVRKTLSEAIATGDTQLDHYRMRLGSGGYKWFSVSGRVSRRDDGTFLNLFYSDATSQMEASSRYANVLARHESELRDEILFCHLNISQNVSFSSISDIFDEGNSGRSVSIDKMVSKISNRVPTGTERESYSAMFSRAAMNKAFRSGTSHLELEHRLLLSDETLWVKSVSDMLINPDTGDLEAVLYIRDTNSEHRLHQLLDAVASTDYDFIVSINVRRCTYKTFRKGGDVLTSFKAEGTYDEAVEGLLKYLHPDDRRTVIHSVQLSEITKKLEESSRFELSYRIIRNGVERSKLLTLSWLDDTQQTIIAFRSDITELLAKEARQREQLAYALRIAERANSAKSDFLSSMSHDIRTPMNAIVGMTDLALEDPENRGQVTESLSIIKESSAHLLTLINDILDMSRIESGKMVLADEPFSHTELFNGTAGMYRTVAESKGLTFLSSISVQNDTCYGDRQRMLRIADNLLGNAIKFTPPGGTVHLSFRELPSEMPGIGLYELDVTDTGMGMSAEAMSHIYEPFFRADSTKTAHIEGSGLGMSIVKNIVDLIGGTIDVSSEPGKGTAFAVCMPLRIAAQPAEEPCITPTFKERDLHGMSILLCEDNYVNQLVATRLLERMGANVSVAEDGQQGCDAFIDNPPGTFDVVLMDVQMPVLNGYEAAALIRESGREDSQTIPIIAMTANAFVEDVRKSLDAGMNVHLTKPIEPDKLYEALSQLQRRQ